MSVKLILDGKDAESALDMYQQHGAMQEKIEKLTSDLCDAKEQANKLLQSSTRGELIRPHLDDFMKGFEGAVPRNKILLIKSVRALTGWGLKESKDYVESFFPWKPEY